MNKETKTKHAISSGCFFMGIFYIFEGLSLTHFGDKVENVPDLIIVLVGFVLLIVSVMLLVGKKERLNNFLASILTLTKGLMFGLGSILSLVISVIAFRVFLKTK